MYPDILVPEEGSLSVEIRSSHHSSGRYRQFFPYDFDAQDDAKILSIGEQMRNSNPPVKCEALQ